MGTVAKPAVIFNDVVEVGGIGHEDAGKTSGTKDRSPHPGPCSHSEWEQGNP